MKSDFAAFGFRRRGHQLADGIKHNLKLPVVFLLQRVQFAGQFGIASDELTGKQIPLRSDLWAARAAIPFK